MPHCLTLASMCHEAKYGAAKICVHRQVCHSMMDQLFHGPEPPESQAAAADALHEIWSKYSSFPSQTNHLPHLRYCCKPYFACKLAFTA